jgi:hypothetical protein
VKKNKSHHVQHPNVKPTIEELSIVHPNAAGMDLGAEEIWVCIPADRDAESVQALGTFTPDLHALVDWLVQCGVTIRRSQPPDCHPAGACADKSPTLLRYTHRTITA